MEGLLSTGPTPSSSFRPRLIQSTSHNLENNASRWIGDFWSKKIWLMLAFVYMFLLCAILIIIVFWIKKIFFWSFWTSLRCKVRELAGGGSVALSVGVSVSAFFRNRQDIPCLPYTEFKKNVYTGYKRVLVKTVFEAKWTRYENCSNLCLIGKYFNDKKIWYNQKYFLET